MKIVTFKEHKTIRSTNGPFVTDLNFNPGERYIVDDFCMNQLVQGIPDALYEYSDLAPLLRREMPINWAGKRVLFWRGCGLGDELMLSAVVRYFREVLHAEPYIMCPAMHRPIWGHDLEHSDSISSHPALMPIHLDAVWRAAGRPFFDYAFFLESVTEWDADQEQENVYDRMYRLCGIDPFKVSAKYKRPYIDLTDHDRAEFGSWKKQLAEIGLNLAGGYIVVQMGPKNPIRDLPEKKSLEVLDALSGCGLQVVVVDDKPLVGPISAAMSTFPGFYSLCGMIPHIRHLFSLVNQAKLVVGPDSFVLHVAAGLDIPSISFFGPVSPESRSKYYPNHHAVWHHELCPHAPCFSFNGFPANKCPKGKEQKSCEVFEGVTGSELRWLVAQVVGTADTRGSRPDAIFEAASLIAAQREVVLQPFETPSNNGDLPQGYQDMARQVEILLDSSRVDSPNSKDP